MFEREMSRMDWMAMAGISIAMTLPFIFIMKDMSDSLREIAGRR